MKMDWDSPGRGPANAEEVRLLADVAQIKTMADGGYRIVLDVGEQDFMAVAKLLQSVKSVVFAVVFTPNMG